MTRAGRVDESQVTIIDGLGAKKANEELVLIIKCAACKKKLWRYDKIGKGELLRCHKDRIMVMYQKIRKAYKVRCECGNNVGIDKGSHIKMIRHAFTYSGTKRN